jgi:hypothetical protein
MMWDVAGMGDLREAGGWQCAWGWCLGGKSGSVLVFKIFEHVLVLYHLRSADFRYVALSRWWCQGGV